MSNFPNHQFFRFPDDHIKTPNSRFPDDHRVHRFYKILEDHTILYRFRWPYRDYQFYNVQMLIPILIYSHQFYRFSNDRIENEATWAMSRLSYRYHDVVVLNSRQPDIYHSVINHERGATDISGCDSRLRIGSAWVKIYLVSVHAQNLWLQFKTHVVLKNNMCQKFDCV